MALYLLISKKDVLDRIVVDFPGGPQDAEHWAAENYGTDYKAYACAGPAGKISVLCVSKPQGAGAAPARGSGDGQGDDESGDVAPANDPADESAFDPEGGDIL